MNYDVTLNPEDENTSHALVLRLVGCDKRVLDVGCATGYLAEALRANGNRVWGVEFDEQAANKAAEHLEGIVVGDVESLDLAREFRKGSFDVIVFADVLEHLKDPTTLLRRSKDLLASGGYVVMSIPNIAHAAVRLSLLKGRFDYQPLGLLDDTHLRFFTRRSLNEMIDQAGFVKTDELRTTAPPFETEIPVFPAEFPPGIVDALADETDSDTYQFVISAVPLDHPGDPGHEIQQLRAALATIASTLAKIDRRPILGVVSWPNMTMQPLADIRLAVLLSELRRRLPDFDLRVHGWSDSPVPAGLGDEPSHPLLPWTGDSLSVLSATTGEVLVLEPPGAPESSAEKIIREMEEGGIAVVRWSQPASSLDVLALASRMPETGLLAQRLAQLSVLGVVVDNAPLLLTHLDDRSLEAQLGRVIESRSDLSAMSQCALDESFNSFDTLTLVAGAELILTDSVALSSLAAGLGRPVGFIGPCPRPAEKGLMALGVALLADGTQTLSNPEKVDPSTFRDIEDELDRLGESLVSAFAVPLERDSLRLAEAIKMRINSLESANLALRNRLVQDMHVIARIEVSPDPSQLEWFRHLERERDLSDEIRSLKEEIDRIYSTRTMRAMRPLRKAYRLARFRRRDGA